MAKQAVTTEYTVSSDKVKSALRIALAADIHERKQGDVLELLKQAKPDLIAVAGDTMERFDTESRLLIGKRKMSRLHRLFLSTAFMVNYFFVQIIGRNNHPETENAYHFIREASKLAPVYLSLGNHEEKLLEEDLTLFRESGVVLLDNSGAEADINGVFLHIGGLSTFFDEQWLESFSQIEGFKLLLCHHPEYYDELLSNKDIDLILSGHNHGGQIRLFGKRMFSAGGGLFPKYVRGLYHDRLVVSAGCSNTVAIPRLGNPRELVIINIIPKN